MLFDHYRLTRGSHGSRRARAGRTDAWKHADGQWQHLNAKRSQLLHATKILYLGSSKPAEWTPGPSLGLPSLIVRPSNVRQSLVPLQFSDAEQIPRRSQLQQESFCVLCASNNLLCFFYVVPYTNGANSVPTVWMSAKTILQMTRKLACRQFATELD